MKKAIIIHRWSGSPEEAMHSWLKIELKNRGFSVTVPEMPNADEPSIDEWVPFLEKIAKNADKDTYFIGHSIGCQAILRYLEKAKVKVGGVVLIAGWFDLTGLESEEEEEIAEPWLNTPINFKSVKEKTDKFVVILSDNDPFVPLEITKQKFEVNLNAKVIIEHNKGHFTKEDGVKKLPSALQAVLEMSKE